MKKLIYAAVFALAVGSSIPDALAGGVLPNAKVFHLLNSAAHPSDARDLSATHYFEVHVSSHWIVKLPFFWSNLYKL